MEGGGCHARAVQEPALPGYVYVPATLCRPMPPSYVTLLYYYMWNFGKNV